MTVGTPGMKTHYEIHYKYNGEWRRVGGSGVFSEESRAVERAAKAQAGDLIRLRNFPKSAPRTYVVRKRTVEYGEWEEIR